MLKAFSALKELFPSPYLFITQIRRESSRFHIAEVGKLRPTEKVSSCLKSCTHQIGQRAGAGTLVSWLSAKGSCQHVLLPPLIWLPGCYAQSHLLCPTQKRHCTMITALFCPYGQKPCESNALWSWKNEEDILASRIQMLRAHMWKLTDCYNQLWSNSLAY